jgi:hypothetical protein
MLIRTPLYRTSRDHYYTLLPLTRPSLYRIFSGYRQLIYLERSHRLDLAHHGAFIGLCAHNRELADQDATARQRQPHQKLNPSSNRESSAKGRDPFMGLGHQTPVRSQCYR